MVDVEVDARELVTNRLRRHFAFVVGINEVQERADRPIWLTVEAMTTSAGVTDPRSWDTWPVGVFVVRVSIEALLALYDKVD